MRIRQEKRPGENFTQLRCMGDGGDADLPEGDASLASTILISCDNYTSTVKSPNFETLQFFLEKCVFLSYVYEGTVCLKLYDDEV